MDDIILLLLEMRPAVARFWLSPSLAILFAIFANPATANNGQDLAGEPRISPAAASAEGSATNPATVLIYNILQSIVTVTIRGKEEDWPNWRPGPQGFSQQPKKYHSKIKAILSGFVIESEGYIVTRHLVLKDTDEVEVTLSDGGKFKAELAGTSEQAQLALLKIASRQPLPVLPLAARSPVPDETMLLIGNPFGFAGSVRSVTFKQWQRPTKNFESIAFTGAINPGDGGGVLADLDGAILGVIFAMTAKNDGYATGYAVPAPIVQSALAQLKRDGKVSDLPSLEHDKEKPTPPLHKFSSELPPAKAIAAREASVAVDAKSAQGIGTIVSADGYIVTTNSVAGKAKTATVHLSDGTALEARVVGTDAGTDLALLKLETGQPLPFADFAKQPPQTGDAIFAWNMFRPATVTLRKGTVSAVGRDVGAGPYDLLQSDMYIGKGESGAGWFNYDGQIVGMGHGIYTKDGKPTGISFAVPASSIAPVVQLLKTGAGIERGWAGVETQDVPEDLAASLGFPKRRGAQIIKVLPESPAATAGLRTGDVVLTFDGTEVLNARHFNRRTEELRPGATVRLELYRAKGLLTLDVKLGKDPSDHARSMSGQAGKPVVSSARTDAMAEVLGLTVSSTHDGLLVKSVRAGSPAEAQGMKPGDIIAEMNYTPVGSIDDANSIIEEKVAKGARVILIRVQRSGTILFAALRILPR